MTEINNLKIFLTNSQSATNRWWYFSTFDS